MGFVLGVVSGIAASILLAPKRHSDVGRRRKSTEAADALLEVARTAAHAGRWVQDRLSATQPGLPPDERISAQIRAELERRGIWTPRLDVTTVDGTVFLRGRESDSIRAETIVGIVRDVVGVEDVVDEIRRE
jgi:hypothetical protein